MLTVKTRTRPTGFPPVSKTLPQAIERVVAELRPVKIILFGSYASGNPTPDSDVDLLIIVEDHWNEKDAYRAVSMALYPRQFPVDIIIKTREDIEKAFRGGSDNGFFIRDIIAEGRILYDRDQRA